MLTIGCHLSVAKGFLAMAKDAVSIDANTFQFFTRNPRGGKAKAIDPADMAAFHEFAATHGITRILAHAPYTLNPCSKNPETREFARATLADDLVRMEETPGQLYNMHPGSHTGQGADTGIEMITDALNEVLHADQTTTLLLETMAGKGSEVGRTFEEIARIIDGVKLSDHVGVCLDTCHIWDAGYDIAGDLDGVVREFDQVIGLDQLKAIHLNDSLNPCGAHKDRHARIGEGHIGFEALSAVTKHPALRDLPFYLETPNDKLSGWGRRASPGPPADWSEAQLRASPSQIANLLVRSIASLKARKWQLHFDETYARRPEHLPVDLRKLARSAHLAIRHVESRRRVGEIDVLRRREQAREVRLIRRLRKHLEDAAAVVVQQHHDDTRSKLSALGRNLGDFAPERKSTQVVLQREIPSEERRLLEMLRDAKGGRHRAVNAVEPSVAQHGKRLVALHVEGVDCANRHRVRGEQARPRRYRLQNLAHVRAFGTRSDGSGLGLSVPCNLGPVGSVARRPLPRIFLYREDARPFGRVRLAPRGKEARARLHIAIARQQGSREIKRRASDEQVGHRVEIARLTCVYDNLNGTRRSKLLHAALRYGVTPEADNHLRGGKIVTTEDVVIVVDDRLVAKRSQSRKRVS